jgi:hypothetical protein
MHASNKAEPPDGPGLDLGAGFHAAAVRGLWSGSLGYTVRCVPTRRTVMAVVDEGRLFGKWRVGHRRNAAAEWRWLHLLPLLGIRVPEPVAWLGSGRRSLLVTAAAAGRACDVWAVEAARDGWLAQWVQYAVRHVAPVVRQLHQRGLCHRDLYWNHVFAVDPRGNEAPTLIDVERVFAPRLRHRRWWIKDLAGLWSSVPVPLPERAALRFLRAYGGGTLRGVGGWLPAIRAKAARIRSHAPRFG